MIRDMRPATVGTSRGEVFLYVGMISGTEVVLLPRHGLSGEVPPHRINHAANFLAMREMEVTSVIGISSVGSLKRHITPPALLIPHDYIEFLTATVQERAVHVLPGLSEEIRRVLIREARHSVKGIRVYDRGIYFQTRGPRLETRAEVAVISKFADVVGMTMGSEATVARELDIQYAAICTVDNYAHGVSDRKVSIEQIRESAARNARFAWAAVSGAVGQLEHGK
jgi:5'-methylthioadenosine phosphorylase